MKLVPTRTVYNTNNHNEYSPFYTENCTDVVINEKWYDELDSLSQTRLISFLHDEKLTYRTEKIYQIPPAYVYTCTDLKIYRFWYNNFSYEQWYTPGVYMPATNLIKLADSQKYTLKKITEERLSGISPSDTDLENLQNIFDTVDIDSRQEYFLRLSCCSYKSDFPVKPLAGKSQFVDVMTSSKIFLRNEYNRPRNTYVVLVPYEEIPQSCEFRLFVHNKKLTAVSQQHCYDVFPYSDSELKNICTALEKMDETKWDFIRYNSFVADVWYNKKENTVKLIECNPFGAFSSSGSALFDWIDDFDLLHGNKQEIVEFRYRV